MKTGIIGLPQVGKTSLFVMLTGQDVSQRSGNPREAHLGVTKVPDDRLDRLAALYNPKKLVHASVEYADVAALSQEALKETAFAANLRNVDALAHVVRVFDDPSIAHVGPVDPLRDIKNIDFDLIVTDLGQVEKRLERLEKDLKKMRTAELEREDELLKRAKIHLETERPLREMEMTADDKKRVRGFMFLSEKPILYVLNIGESSSLDKDLEAAVEKYGLTEIVARPNTGAIAVCAKVEAELAEMSPEDAAEFLVQLRIERERPGAPHPQELRAAGADLVLHRWRRRVPRLDGRTQLKSRRRRGRDSHRSVTSLHPRRNHSLGRAARSRLRSQRPRQRHSAPGRQRVHRERRRRDAHPA